MSKTVQVCLTNTGTSPLGPNLNIYSNPTSPLLHGALVEVTPTTSITGNNCPYLLVVPNTTTTVRIFDPLSFCYVDIPVTDSDVCNTCDLGLSGITTTSPSLINVNGLSGTCDNDITDFVLDWYGPSPSTNLAFTSGKGTLFSGQYQYVHPINNVNSPILVDGTYTSRIRNVELNGIKFSSTGGSTNVLSTTLSACTTEVAVSPYNCGNGQGGGDPLYTHYKEFVFTNPAVAPSALNAVFVLSANTKAFAWKFEGLSIYDTLKLTLSGSAYPQPLLLEQIRVGSDSGGTNFTPSTWPKIFGGQSFKKITILSGLTISNNDKIGINITPNPDNNATTWRYHFGCSALPTATKTCLDSYKNNTYKIKASTIQSFGPDTCGKYRVIYSVSGCSVNETTGFTNSTLVKLNSSSNFNNIATDNTTKLLQLDTGYDLFNNFSQISSCGPSRDGTCVPIPGQQIKTVKTATTQFEIYFTHLSDLQAYLTDWTDAQNSIVNACGIYSSNNATFSYFKFITLAVWDGTYTCGDVTPSYESQFFHYSSVVSSGSGTPYPGFNYYMYITTPLITSSNYTCPNTCSNCGNASAYTTAANNTRNLTGYFRNVTGYRTTQPFRDVNGLKSSTTSKTSASFNGDLTVSYTYSNNTYPASGVTNTLIPSLSGRTWDWENHTYQSGESYAQTVFSHNLVVTSWSPFQYKIQALQISNFNATGGWIDVWSSTSGILNSNYVYP
jgi:hypothetical protein